ncbi:MAG: hypothetical protein SF162_00115 [bacterium]|nr:hypothetical protein [bacterium]
MTLNTRLISALAAGLLLLTACAPENLDITPTATATDTPIPTATRDATATAAARQENDATRTAAGGTMVAMVSTAVVETLAAGGSDAVPQATPTEAAPAATEAAAIVAIPTEPQALLDYLLAGVPGRVNAGAIQWNRSSDPITYQAVDGGVTGRISFNEAGGGYSEVTLGVFESPDAALTYWETVRGNLRTLENAEQRDNFPLPNAFGGGTYGSDAIFAREGLFLRVSVPRFSSTTGNPLIGYSRELFRIFDGLLGITT